VKSVLREFILYSRLGRTDPRFTNLHEAGRLDIVHECIVASLFFSHGLRRDTIFHAILNGPPKPPIHIRIEGATLYDVRTDQETWTSILKNVFSGKLHPGITTDRIGFEVLLKTNANEASIFVLEEGGNDISEISLGENPIFVLGDHVGLPKKAESFALRYGKKVSLGKQTYLASSCITVLNYLLDVGTAERHHRRLKPVT
jgi:tRNA (pseudouridine54-N1)-methyltransferase